MLWMCSLRQFSDRWSSSMGMVRCTTFRWHFKGMLALLHLCTSGCPVTDLMEDASSSKPPSCWGGWALPEPGCVHKPAWQMANEMASGQRAVQRNLPKVLVQAPDEPPAAAGSCEGKGCECESWWRGELPEPEERAGKCRLLRQGGKPRAGSSPASCWAARGKVNRAGIRGWTLWTPTQWSYTNN